MTTHVGRYIGETFLFSTYLESDIRPPLLAFSMPTSITQVLLGGEHQNVEIGLIMLSLDFWISLLVVVLIGSAFNLAVAIVSYYFIVLPRKRTQQRHKKDDGKDSNSNARIMPYLIGFGVVMPLAVYYPFFCIPIFGVRNKVLKFFFGVQSITTFFRCSEAIFGYLPKYVDDSLYNVIIYNLFPIETMFDANGPLKSTWNQVWEYVRKLSLFIILLGGYCSFLSAYNYEPFQVGDGVSFWDVGQLSNNALIALLFQLYLTTFGYGLFTITSICGLQQGPMMLNPIFESTSPSDFWGRKWNMVVHGLLKRGVYKPVRSLSQPFPKYSRFTASMAAFIASGVFHEWLLSVIFLPDDTSVQASHKPTYGQATAFFVWNSIIIALEYSIGGAVVFQVMRNNLPPTVLSLFVSLTALPMAHWFTHDYVKSDFFHDGQIAFPMLVLKK